MLKEVTPAQKEGAETGVQVMTDEIEEKDVAIQMLSVFIDEVPEICYDYVEQLSALMLSMTTYAANDSIRQSSA